MNGLMFVSAVLLFISVSLIDGYSIPQITVEALQNGDFRVYMPDSAGVKRVEIHANVNKQISILETGDFFAELLEKTGDFWIAKFSNGNIKVGDTVFILVSAVVENFSYRKEGINVTISELLPSFPVLKSKCVISVTVYDGGKQTCVGDILINDEFRESQINTNKWKIAQYIPSYTDPSFLFNSYQNKEDTCFIRTDKLHLKPISLKTKEELRYVLDLRNGCTSTLPEQCFFQPKAWNIAPPIRAAKINSNISFKYGKVEIRAKLPAGEWIFPVVQLEKKVKTSGDDAPKVLIAYSRGNDVLQGNDGNDIGSKVLFAGPVTKSIEPVRSQYLISTHASKPFFSEYHIYSLQWEPSKMTFAIDGVDYGTVDLKRGISDNIDLRGMDGSVPESLFNSEYVLSLGVGVGGLVDFPDDYTSSGKQKPWLNIEPRFLTQFFDKKLEWQSSWKDDNVALQVDYVKVTAI